MEENTENKVEKERNLKSKLTTIWAEFREKSKNEIFSVVVIVLGIFVALGSLIWFLFYIEGEFDKDLPLDTNYFDHYGSFIGGVVGSLFSLATLLLVIETLKQQKKDSDKQREEFKLSLQKQQNEFEQSQFITHFYSLLTIHKQNVESIEFFGKTGYSALIQIYYSFKYVFDELRKTVSHGNELEIEETKKLIELAYNIIFYGLADNYIIQIKKEFKDSTSSDKNWNYGDIFYKIDELAKDSKDEFEKFGKEKDVTIKKILNGNQSRLSHYLSHLYRVVVMVHTKIKYKEEEEQDYLKNRYNYLKIFRAQLIPHEQILLMATSFSEKGSMWRGIDGGVVIADDLLTKYKLIKDININFLMDVGIVIYELFPLIPFDGLTKSQLINIQHNRENMKL